MSAVHRLPATPSTVHWGYFDSRLTPVLTVASGDLVEVEAVTHHAGDAPDLLMDDGIERLFAEVDDRGPGPHLLTGPIAVEGARPGDVLQVDILDARPRLAYGSNLAANWGHLHDDFAKERVTIYALDTEALLGRTAFAFDWITPRDDAYSLASVAVDFTVTQVVDGRQGVHGRIEKRWFPRWP